MPNPQWVIMPFLNAWEMTAQAVDDILAQTLPSVRLLLIDQGSDERTRQTCEVVTHNRWERQPIYTWRHDPPLPSLSATWNCALRFVWEQGGEHAWVVNNDVRLLPQTYEALLQVQQATGGWFISAVNDPPGWDRVRQAYGLLPFDKAFLNTRGGPDFSCFLITRECHRWFQFDEGFQPAYHEDNDYHRRLELAGFGEKIFSVCVPYYHIGSGTLKANDKLREGWGPKFEACQRYYVQKWGGLPGSETFTVPFELVQRDGDLGFADHRILYLGQGRGDFTDVEAFRELCYGQT